MKLAIGRFGLRNPTRARLIAFDTETDSLNLIDNPIIGISLCFNESDGYYLPLQHSNDKNLSLKETLEKLKPIFESNSILKIGHNINFDYSVILNQCNKLNINVEIKNFSFAYHLPIFITILQRF